MGYGGFFAYIHYETRGISVKDGLEQEVSGCVGVAERLTPRRKISEIGFSWMKETLLFSF
jgi:hypothetical protein